MFWLRKILSLRNNKYFIKFYLIKLKYLKKTKFIKENSTKICKYFWIYEKKIIRNRK